MQNFNSYFFNYICSIGLVGTLSELMKIEIIKNVLDLLIMLLMVIVSKFITTWIERKYKRFLVKLKNYLK